MRAKSLQPLHPAGAAGDAETLGPKGSKEPRSKLRGIYEYEFREPRYKAEASFGVSNPRKMKTYRVRKAIYCSLVFCLLTCLEAGAGEPLRVFFLRHGEGGHNVMNEWKSKPKSEWPSYVGNPDAFTPKGEAQVAEATKKLAGMKLDFIAVSPLWRARNTILPYLKSTSARAEIWPELTETRSTGTATARDLPPPSSTLFEGAGNLKIPDEEAAFFTFRDGAKQVLKGAGNDETQATADAIALSEKTALLLRERFGRSGKTILLVGHGNAGVTLIRILTGSPVPALENARLWMAEEQPDGSFQLTILNGEPFPKSPKELPGR